MRSGNGHVTWCDVEIVGILETFQGFEWYDIRQVTYEVMWEIVRKGLLANVTCLLSQVLFVM